MSCFDNQNIETNNREVVTIKTIQKRVLKTFRSVGNHTIVINNKPINQNKLYSLQRKQVR